MSLLEGTSVSSSVGRKPRRFKLDQLVKTNQHLSHLHAEIHPPLREGAQHTIEIRLDTEGIYCGRAPNGDGHLVAFEFGKHHTATAIVPSDSISRL